MGLVFIHVCLCDRVVFPPLASGILNLSHKLVTVQMCLLFELVSLKYMHVRIPR